jgi:hypothetical protein
MEIIYLNFDKILSKIALKKELKEKEKKLQAKVFGKELMSA